jgi:hypothetical protein
MGPLRLIAPLMLAAAFAPTPTHALLHSRELWATVDVCSPKDQPNTLGVRGSMPGDSSAKDVMYMRFRVQYLDATTKQWIALGKEADSGFVKVGSAQLARQDGHSFTFAQSSAKYAFTLRGEVIFQWRKANTVLLTTTLPTTAGHVSLAGADPKGYSAATCKLT